MGERINWKEAIMNEMKEQNETWDIDIVSHTLTTEELLERFNSGFGGSEGCPFTLWTKKRVYFPVVYDGAEWVDSVPRDPCEEKTRHIGGE